MRTQLACGAEVSSTHSALLAPLAPLAPREPQDATGVEIRPARMDDAERVRDFIAGLSPRTQMLRFFTGIGRPGDRLVRVLLSRDGGRDALLAVRRTGDGEQVVGHAMSAPAPGGGTAPLAGPRIEIAVVVADEWQGRGIGGRLVRLLLARAAARGAVEIAMDVHGENRRLLHALRRRWPQATMRAGFGTVEVRTPFVEW
jgi:Predicted acetyltransferase